MSVEHETMCKILGRSGSFVDRDISDVSEVIAKQLLDASVLVIGAGGSIGRAFVEELTNYKIRSLHLVDLSENNLVEVVRNLRSSGKHVPRDFSTFAIDFSLPEFDALLRKNHYDYVMNFAALKHVRSERDAYTLMRMLQVNVVANAHLADNLQGNDTRVLFSVSSDKAVRSGNAMGASKAFMERVLLSRSETVAFQSARFANVAFSDGSLLDSFQRRLNKRQPISAPDDVRRYFISPMEAGQLCLLGCFAGSNREIAYPKFKPDSEMTFSEIAVAFLKDHGLRPIECTSEEHARTVAQELTTRSREWPCFFSESDTSGEKAFEEFFNPVEQVDENRHTNVGVVTHPISKPRDEIETALSRIDEFRKSMEWTKDSLIDVIHSVVPEWSYKRADKNLDQKM